MPRFRTLSDAIKSQIPPPVQFPDGTALAIQAGQIPVNPDLQNVQKPTYFRFGYSTFGLDEIYKP